jgi:hypothetical protein
MQFIYGGYAHDVNSVHFTRVVRSLPRGANQRANLLTTEWGLRGKIIRSTQAEIFAQLALLKLAYSVDGFSAGMYDNNGQKTTFFLDNSIAVGGVRVSRPISHGEIKGAEGTTYLYYEFGLSADYLSGPGGYLEFEESLSFDDIDGGPIQVERLPAQGPPLLQNVTEKSWYYCTQQGRLKQQGNVTQVGPQPMLFPNLLRRTPGSKVITYGPTEMIKGVPVAASVSWKYDYISISPIGGYPNIGN